jgi:hypothetical protein
MNNQANQMFNCQYFLYPNQQMTNPYPSLTQSDESTIAEVNDQEELKNIVHYIKNLRDTEKR